MLSFRPTFSPSSFIFIERLFSSSLLSAIRVVSSPHLRLLIFLLEILIPACDSSSLAFPMMYSASVQFSSVAQWCLTVSNSMDCSMPCLSVHHQLQEFTQTHVHRIGDAIQPLILCCPLLLQPSIFPSIRVFSNEFFQTLPYPVNILPLTTCQRNPGQ